MDESTEQNKLIVHRFVDEFWNARNLSVADEIFSSNCVTHQLRGDDKNSAAPRSPETIKKEAADWIGGFPDLKFEVIQILAEGDRVASHLQVTGTHSGEWMGMAATTQSVSFPLFVIHRIEDNKIVEDWVLVGTLTLLQQLGVVAPTAELVREIASGK